MSIYNCVCNCFHFSRLRWSDNKSRFACILGIIPNNHCWKSWKLCMGTSKLESAWRVCSYSFHSSWTVCFDRAASSASPSSSCMINLSLLNICFIFTYAHTNSTLYVTQIEDFSWKKKFSLVLGRFCSYWQTLIKV